MASIVIVTAIPINKGNVLDCVLSFENCAKVVHKWTISRKVIRKIIVSGKASYTCNLNYSGFTLNMEKVVTVEMYERSVDKHGLYYIHFYRDCDSKSYNHCKRFLRAKKPVIKFECISHYQKRMGFRLYKQRKDKKYGGRNRLTKAFAIYASESL